MWVLLLYLCLFLACAVLFKLGQKKFIKSSKLLTKELDVFSAFVLSALTIVGTAVVYAYKELPIYSLNVLLCLILAVFYVSQNDLTKRTKFIIGFVLSFLGVLGTISSDVFSCYYLTACFCMALFWFIGWRLFCYFDERPMLSYITSTSWSLALFLVTMMISVFPNTLGVVAGIVGVCFFAICRFRLSLGFLTSGPYAREIAGFLWGGIWTLVVLNSNPTLLILPFGYYIIECFRILIARFKKKSFETIFETALKTENKRKKAISVLFTHIFILSVLCAVLSVLGMGVHKNNLVILVLLAIIGIDLYNNLTNIDRPVGTWKDMISSMKEGIKQLPKGIKSVLDTPKERLKKKKTTKAKTKVRKK